MSNIFCSRCYTANVNFHKSSAKFEKKFLLNNSIVAFNDE